jgi:hypothetical protein
MSDMRRMPSSVRVLVVAICHIRQLGDGARVSVERSEPLPKGEGPAPMLTRYHGARHRQKWRQGLCAILLLVSVGWGQYPPHRPARPLRLPSPCLPTVYMCDRQSHAQHLVRQEAWLPRYYCVHSI